MRKLDYMITMSMTMSQVFGEVLASSIKNSNVGNHNVEELILKEQSLMSIIFCTYITAIVSEHACDFTFIS